MKTLILVRHAKSAREQVPLSDRDRPLTDRGRRDAPRMAERLHRRGVQPDLLVSSPARRALGTAQLMARPLRYERGGIAVDERLYPGDAAAVLEVIHGLDPSLRCVMLVGHDPGLSELAHRFCRAIDHLPTCTVAEFAFEADTWSQIGSIAVLQVTLDCPRKT
ncbi:MAG: SixA phosphatase family protein [Steroidobacteraceae bacterium]